MSSRLAWISSVFVALALSSYLAHAMSFGDRRQFLPGSTTSGHHQIEERCELCHSASFSDREVLQAACVECHAEELRQAEDSHPRSKFTDPRNADRVAVLDARYCITCHIEHRPEATGAMGLTLPGDYCFHCHQDVGEERPSHQGLPFDGCAASGCHNYHDNTALYEDFLLANHESQELLAEFHVPSRFGRPGIDPSSTDPSSIDPSSIDPSSIDRQGTGLATHRGPRPLGLSDVDAPLVVRRALDPAELRTWAETVHPRHAVNCSECHVGSSPGLAATASDGSARASSWSDQVAPQACGECHRAELEGFRASRHGMRVAAALGPMQPRGARVSMRSESADEHVDCSSCHTAHFFDTSYAASEACLGCHADEHSRSFEASPHARFEAAPGPQDERISCATCHLPRVVRPDGSVGADHNQNANLRPNDKMARNVCMQCHGLGFSLDALADPELIRNNFSGKPARHVESIDWALRRVREAADSKEQAGTQRSAESSDSSR